MLRKANECKSIGIGATPGPTTTLVLELNQPPHSANLDAHSDHGVPDNEHGRSVSWYLRVVLTELSP